MTYCKARSHWPKLSLLFVFFVINQSYAENVQRWQDKQGQWHFGDAAATHDRASQPVRIQTPISVVQNDHLDATMPHENIKKTKKSSHKKPKKSTANNTVRCETMREKINQPQSQRKSVLVRQKLITQYEKQCVIGHYYGG